jgi:hypothetical protein
MIVTKRKLTNIAAALERLSEHSKGVKLSYAIAKNLGKIQSELAPLQKAAAPGREYIKFLEEKKQAQLKFACKDPEGKPVIIGNDYAISNMADFVAEIDALKDRFAAAIEEQERKSEDVDELLDEEAEFEFHKIDAALLEDAKSLEKDIKGLGVILAPLMGTIIDG